MLTWLHQAQADVQHLWYGRRAATHIRSELMAAIYDKALKRRDYSGIIDKNKTVIKEEAPTENGHSKSEFSYFPSSTMLISQTKKKRRAR